MMQLPESRLPTANKPTYRSGVVMLELIFATAFVGVAVIAIYLALIFGQNVSVRANRYARASQIASQEIENIRATSFANLTTPYNGAFIGTTNPVTELPTGTANLTTSYYNSPTNTIKKAIVTVTWKERTKTESVQYTTLIVNNGLYQ